MIPSNSKTSQGKMLGSADPGVVAFIKSYNDIKSLTDKYKRKKHHHPFYIPFLELTLIFLMKFSSKGYLFGAIEDAYVSKNPQKMVPLTSILSLYALSCLTDVYISHNAVQPYNWDNIMILSSEIFFQFLICSANSFQNF